MEDCNGLVCICITGVASLSKHNAYKPIHAIEMNMIVPRSEVGYLDDREKQPTKMNRQ